MEVEQIMEEDQSLPLTDENVEKVLDEIRPYLVGRQHCRDCLRKKPILEWHRLESGVEVAMTV